MPANEVRVVLDTNIVRGIGAGEVDAAGILALHRQGASVHLADGTLAEIMNQLSTGGLAWTEWVRARTNLLEFIPHDEPVLLGGRFGLHRAGLLSRHEVLDENIESELEICDAAWTLLIGKNTLDELQAGKINLPRQGIRVSLPQAHVVAAHAEHRAGWADDFDDFARKVLDQQPDVQELLVRGKDFTEALNVYIAVAKEKVDDGRPPSKPTPSLRLDAFLRVQALLHLRHLRSSRPYNPEKNANDIFDHELLKYLAFPAMVCTNDARLITKVRESGSWQLKWILRPDELLDPMVRERVRELTWPGGATG